MQDSSADSVVDIYYTDCGSSQHWHRTVLKMWQWMALVQNSSNGMTVNGNSTEQLKKCGSRLN